VIENTKCECGHQNHVGTVLCESCGKPLVELDPAAELEMRYDGVARRSQRSNPTILDRVWNFFSSVRIAIYLIFITLLGAMLGTILPQENTFENIDPAVFYKDTYGSFGTIYYKLGLSHTYESWWFVALLFMIGVSLVVCSLDRVLPLYRALSKQQIRKHLSFILRQKVAFSEELPDKTDTQEWTKHIAAALRKRRYKVVMEDGAILAEKNRFSRWGPYINHIGLIIFLLAVLARSIPSWHMDQRIWLMEGEVKPIPETSYYIKNEKFTREFYEGTNTVKKYETKAVLYHCTADCNNPVKTPQLEQVQQADIIVNKPLDYKGLLAYQSGYAEAPQLISVKPSLRNAATGEVYGSFDLPMSNPPDSFKVGPYMLKLRNYFPDFEFKDGMPVTKSNQPNAPAFIFIVSGPGLADSGEPYIYFPLPGDKVNFGQDQINGALAKKLDISVGTMDNVKLSMFSSELNLRVDKAMPYIWTGTAISMIGLIMGFYWHHRRIWLRIDDGQLSLGAHTNKNWFGIRKEVAAILAAGGIVVNPKTLEKGGEPS
jgi:cytochrome c biogenesis protein